MFRITGKMAGPIGLKFFVDTRGWSGGVIGEKKIDFFTLFFNFFL